MDDGKSNEWYLRLRERNEKAESGREEKRIEFEKKLRAIEKIRQRNEKKKGEGGENENQRRKRNEREGESE